MSESGSDGSVEESEYEFECMLAVKHFCYLILLIPVCLVILQVIPVPSAPTFTKDLLTPKNISQIHIYLFSNSIPS